MKFRIEYRYLLCLLIGGIVFLIATEYPKQILSEEYLLRAGLWISEKGQLFRNEWFGVDETVQGNAESDTEGNVDRGSSDVEEILSKEGDSPADLNSEISAGEGETSSEREGNVPEPGTENLSQELQPRQFVNVGMDYFEDACFFGDSRMVSLFEYGDMPGTFFCRSGMIAKKFFSDPKGRFKDGSWEQNVSEAVAENDFGKIYLMVGINDLGQTTVEGFQETYEEIVRYIREQRPDADIFVMSIMHVSQKRDAQGDHINNEAIEIRNEGLQKLEDGEHIFFLDINPIVCDEGGFLTKEFSSDGVHLHARNVQTLVDFLMDHGLPPI